MRILMVTPYAPLRDGIAAYAVQQVGGVARRGPRRRGALAGPVGGPPLPRLHRPARHRGADQAGARLRQGHHPVPPRPVLPAPDHARPACRGQCGVARDGQGAAATSRSSCTRSTTGSASARAWIPLLPRLFGVRSTPSSCTLTPSATTSSRRSGSSRTGSRSSPTAHPSSSGPGPTGRRRGAPSASTPDAFVFLSIGFIQPHKGFDRAVRAFSGLADHGCELHVVGSIRVDDPGFASYLGELEGLVETTERHLAAHRLRQRRAVRPLDRRGRRRRAALPQHLELRRPRAGHALRPPGAGHRRRCTGRTGRRPAAGDDGRRRRRLMAAMRSLVGQGRRGRVRRRTPWELAEGAEPLRVRVQDELVARAQIRRGGRAAVGERGAVVDRTAAASASRRSAALRRLPPLAPPAAVSGRRGASTFKRLVRTGHRVGGRPGDPPGQRLRDAVVQAIEEPSR